MVVVLCNVDRQAAILAGRNLPFWVSIDISPGDLGDVWPQFVHEYLAISSQETSVKDLKVDDATVPALCAALEKDLARRRQVAINHMARVRAAMEKLRQAAASEPGRRTLLARSLDPSMPPGMFEGFSRMLPYVPLDEPRGDPRFIGGTFTADELAELKAFGSEAAAIQAASETEIAALNATAVAAAREPLLRLHQESLASAKATAEAEAAAKAAKAAERLRTGQWEVTVGSYNARRYSPPWCAKVTGTDARGQLVYEFGISTSKHGEGGLLQVPCRPGEIISWGQKDNRGNHSEHVILRMREDGSMETIDRTEAFKHLRKS